MQPTYVAGKVIRVGEDLRRPGDPVPEAKDWSPLALRASLGVGEIVELLDGRPGKDATPSTMARIAVYEASPEVQAVDPIVEGTRPRARRDVHADKPSYPGQNVESRPIIQSFLQDDSGEWVEVPAGMTELPELMTDEQIDELALQALKQQGNQAKMAKLRAKVSSTWTPERRAAQAATIRAKGRSKAQAG